MKHHFCLTRSQLKWVAIIAMTVDHIAYAFIDNHAALYYVMRTFGKLTAPIMSFFLVEGFCHTKNLKNYMLRMTLFAMMAQPFYFVFIKKRMPDHAIEVATNLNVLFTLTISLCILWIVSRPLWSIPKKLLMLIPCIVLSDICDWSFLIPVWVLIFYYFRSNENTRNQMFIFASAILLPYRYLSDYDSFCDFSFNLGVVLSVVPLHFYQEHEKHCLKRKKSFMSRWFFYLFYPLHIAVIDLLLYAKK